MPSGEQKWKQVAREYYKMWNFPHTLGAIDGKHVVMQAPHNSGSEYFNYKKNSQYSSSCCLQCKIRIFEKHDETLPQPNFVPKSEDIQLSTFKG